MKPAIVQQGTVIKLLVVSDWGVLKLDSAIWKLDSVIWYDFETGRRSCINYPSTRNICRVDVNSKYIYITSSVPKKTNVYRRRDGSDVTSFRAYHTDRVSRIVWSKGSHYRVHGTRMCEIDDRWCTWVTAVPDRHLPKFRFVREGYRGQIIYAPRRSFTYLCPDAWSIVNKYLIHKLEPMQMIVE